jgi:hypothetical protein
MIFVVVVKKITDINFCDTFFEWFEYREGLQQTLHLCSIRQLSDEDATAAFLSAIPSRSQALPSLPSSWWRYSFEQRSWLLRPSPSTIFLGIPIGCCQVIKEKRWDRQNVQSHKEG